MNISSLRSRYSHPFVLLPIRVFPTAIGCLQKQMGSYALAPPRRRSAAEPTRDGSRAIPAGRPGEPLATVGRREPATGHFSAPSRPSTRRNISCAASTPDIILPISSGGIAVIILALSVRPSPNGTPGARRRTTAVMRAWNIDGASMMTAPTGGRWHRQRSAGSGACRRRGRHFLGGLYGFHCKGVTASGVPLREDTQPAAVRLHGCGFR
jgi:hypothetical protein